MQPLGNSLDGLKGSDVDPRLVFHQGVPSGGAKFAYDNIQKILALSTKYVHPLSILRCTLSFLTSNSQKKMLQLKYFLEFMLESDFVEIFFKGWTD